MGDYNVLIMLLFGGALVFVGIAYLVTKAKEKNKKKTIKKGTPTPVKEEKAQSPYKKNPNANVGKEDIFKFMEFDRIQDDMIIQQNGEKYTAILKCKGINYALMSEVEQLSVEEGFMNFLNTLKFPIQLYVQAQTVNLKSNVSDYKENMRTIYNEYDDVNAEYNSLINSLEATDDEIQEAEDKRNSVLNVLEYGQDIVRYVERLAQNKAMLQRSFYILVSYYKSELTNASSFNKEELLDICFSELYTRVQNIMSGLSMCSVTAEPLNSNEIAELLYSAYNRDDKNFLSVEQALESGFHRLYSVSEDAVIKKRKKLAENIRKEAEYKAIKALAKAMEDGTYATKQDAEDIYDQETSKQAIEIVKKERVSDEVKQKAKQVIVDEYKANKKVRLEKDRKELADLTEKINSITGNTESESETDNEEIIGSKNTEPSAEDTLNEDTNV